MAPRLVRFILQNHDVRISVEHRSVNAIETKPDPLRPSLRRFFRCWLMLALVVPVGGFLYFLVAIATDSQQKVTPELTDLLGALLWGIPLVWFCRIAFRSVLDVPAWPARLRFGLKAGAAHLALTIVSRTLTMLASVGLTLLFSSHSFDLFPDSRTGTSVESPTGSVGYLYKNGLFCGYSVYERRGWSVTVNRTQNLSTEKCDGDSPPELHWSKDLGRFEVVLTNPSEEFGSDLRLIEPWN